MKLKIAFGALFFLCAVTCHAQDSSATFTKVIIESEYPGGDTAWTRYLNHHLHYPDKAVDNEISGDIVVQFRIDAEGNTSDYKVISGPTRGGLREEAIRVIRESGKWVPSVMNGKSVESFKRKTISFRMMKG